MSVSVASTQFPRVKRRVRNTADGWNRVGRQTRFYARTIRGIWDVLVHYRVELIRLIAQMSLGSGALAIIGGTIVIVGFLTFAAGGLVGIVGFNQLAQVGVDALAGFVSAFVNTRLAAPLIAGVGLAATIGAGATAQLGAMRISEEIDALEVMGIRSVAYLASSRVLAGVIVVIPLYCIAILTSYLATYLGVTFFYGQSTGVYNHYFRTFLNPLDVIYSFLLAIVMAVVIMLVHTYYGYNASGGPAGVGEAVGRAVRSSLVAAVLAVLLVSLAVYGQSGQFNLSG